MTRKGLFDNGFEIAKIFVTEVFDFIWLKRWEPFYVNDVFKDLQFSFCDRQLFECKYSLFINQFAEPKNWSFWTLIVEIEA